MMLKLQRHQVRHLLDGFAVVGIIQGIVFLLVLEGSYIWPFGYVKFPELLHMAGGLQGLFGNTSMAACVSALTVPLMLEGGFYRWKWLRLGSLFSALAVIYAAQSTMGFLTLIVGTAGYYLSKLRTLRQSLKLIFASLLAVIALGILFDYQFFDLEKIDRLQAWPKFMRWWLDKLPLLWQWLPAQFIGTGNGTFWFLGPIVQQQVGLPKDQGFWTWLHNDWLQLTFEEGYIGLVLGLNMAMFTLLRAYREHKYDVFGSLCAYGFLGLGMYPANLAFTALFGMTLVRSAFQKSRVR